MLGSDSTAGEIVATSSIASTTSNTYKLKATDITAWLTTPVALSGTAFGIPNTSIADPYFQFFYCGGSRDHTYTCYKY